MNREEAMAHGLKVHETKHSMKRRCPWHDYRKKGTYMLTLVVEGRVPLFGELKGNAEAPLGFPDAPRVEYSELGRAIELTDGTFVCKSTTPGAECSYEVKPLMQLTDKREGSFDLEAPAFVVTAYANATGYATSSKVSRTFSLRDVIGPDATNVRDVDGNGSVNKADVEALVNKLLNK